MGLSTTDLQLNYALLTELEWRRNEADLMSKEIEQQEEQITNYKNLIDLQKQVETNLNEQLELIKPAWYDNFLFGAVTGVAATALIIFLAK